MDKIKKEANEDLFERNNIENIDNMLNTMDGTGRMKYNDKSLENNNEQHEDAECYKCNDCIYIGYIYKHKHQY